MTKNNEQIIDDLDTRCPYHCNEKIGQCNNPSQETPHTYCIDNKDCIYKQYARKEQECEELKAKCKKYGEINEQETKDYAVLKAKNERLKKQYLILIQQLNIDAKQLDQLKKENEELKEEFKLFQQLKDEDSFRVVELSTENVKLKHQLDLYKQSHKTEQDRRRVFEQTLEEIRKLLLRTGTDSQEHCVNTKSVILQKINEVIDEQKRIN